MKLLTTLLFLFPAILLSQNTSDFNTITKSSDGIYFMYYDSSKSKSTIVEFKDFLVLIEVPVKDKASDDQNLKDHSSGGEKVIATLENFFPGKPLKYVLSSHWHAHSISSVKPFISRGITLVTTEKNFAKLKTFIDEETMAEYGKNIFFVKDDSLVINDEVNKIVAYKFEKKDYPSTPTEDYLYFYFPERGLFHCGCMFPKWEGGPVYGKDILSSREVDLYKFINSKNIDPGSIIRLSREKDVSDLTELGHLVRVNESGIRSADILKSFLEIDEKVLVEKRDSLVQELVINNVPSSIINNCVYRMFEANNLSKALNYAKIQAMYNPSDANVWDTLGEAFFLQGNYELAAMYEKQSRIIDPLFNAGRAVWEENLKEYKLKWEEKK